MFQFSVTNLADRGLAIATLDTDDPNEVVPLTLEGEADIDLRYALDGSYGAFGHTLNVDETTAIDLHAALTALNGAK
jgi:hypothetical protein